MNDLRIGLAGEYKLVAHTLDNDGNVKSSRLLADWFPNIITDVGLERLGESADAVLDRCHVGSGNATPLTTDTALQTFVAQTGTQQDASSGASSTAPYYGYVTKVFRFGVGVAAGNLSEVGVGWVSASAGPLFSRALILDGGGAPTTITVLPTEVLDVTYRLRFYSPTSDVTGTITISGVNYSYTIRAASVNKSSSPAASGFNSRKGWGPGIPLSGTLDNVGINSIEAQATNGVIGSVTGSPAGTASGSEVGSVIAYIGGTLYRESQVTWGLNDSNLSGGIRSVEYWFDVATFQIQFDPILPKDATKQLQLRFRLSWNRL